MAKVAIMGCGTVGSGVFNVLTENREEIKRKTGADIEVKYVLDLREFPGQPVEKVLTHNFDDIVNDPEVSVVVETMGGLRPSYPFTKACLEAGKSVCTSNKELVAAHGAELLKIAKEKNINYLYEASVGGGIPIIRPLTTSLTADVIESIEGIVNGTTNYILSKMSMEGLDFDSVLKDAQAKGFAELHPEADIEGWDPCRKIAILTSLVSGQLVDYNDVYTEGITKITAEDIAYAKQMNCAIKLIASSRLVDGKYYAMVSPRMVPADHPLAGVNGVFNAIFVRGNKLGDSMFYGSGAGSLPTASAVAGDVVDAVVNADRSVMATWTEEKIELGDIKTAKNAFFVRIRGCKNCAKKLFGDAKTVEAGFEGEIGVITDVMTEAEFDKIAEGTDKIINRIRLQ